MVFLKHVLHSVFRLNTALSHSWAGRKQCQVSIDDLIVDSYSSYTATGCIMWTSNTTCFITPHSFLWLEWSMKHIIQPWAYLHYFRVIIFCLHSSILYLHSAFDHLHSEKPFCRELGSVYSRIWKLPVIFFGHCPCTVHRTCQADTARPMPFGI